MKMGKGFTLIELLVVIAILGVLIALAVTRFASLATERDIRTCQASIRSVNSAIQIYTSQSDGTWPTALGQLRTAGYLVRVPTCPTDNTTYTLDTDNITCDTATHNLPGF